jgi:hypothetical protein
MGLRCLLGHDFSEPRTERDREERGDEVVITISEVKECSRCGETRVVSENKEVTSVDQLLEESGSAAAPPPSEPAGAGGAAPTDATDGRDATTAASDAPDAQDASNATGAGASADSEAPTAGDGTAGATGGTEADVHEEFDHPTADPTADEVDPDAEEDAEILDADGDAAASGNAATAGADAEPAANTPESGGRAHGEWPDVDANRRGDDGDGEPAEWPDADRNASTETAGEAGTNAQHRPADGESEDVEFIGGADEGDEDAAANEARTDVVSDAKRADEPGAAADPAGEDVEFIDGDRPSEWPEQAGDDEGFDAEIGEAGDGEGVSVDGNLTPQVDSEVASQEDVEFIEADTDADAAASERVPPSGEAAPGDATPGRGDGASAPDSGSSRLNVELQTTADRVDTVYVCPECGNNEAVGASSMRAGDICPECKRGYIEEREIK